MTEDITVEIKPEILESAVDRVLGIIDKRLSDQDVLPNRESVKRGIEQWVKSFAREMVTYIDIYGFGPNFERYGDLEEKINLYEKQ
jgi:hypothetical protein